MSDIAKLLDDLLVAGDSLRIAISQANQLPTESSFMLLEQREAEYKAARAEVEAHVSELESEVVRFKGIYNATMNDLHAEIAKVQSLTAEVARLTGMLAECYVYAGSEVTGSPEVLAERAVRAVKELRKDYDDAGRETDAACDETQDVFSGLVKIAENNRKLQEQVTTLRNALAEEHKENVGYEECSIDCEVRKLLEVVKHA